VQPAAAIGELRPDLQEAIAAQYRALMLCGSVPRMTKELCATMVSGLNFCTPSMIAHRRSARHCGVSAATLNDLWHFTQSDRFSSAEKAVLAAAVALTREPRALPDAVRAQLREHYDGGQTLEILCVIGLVNYLDRVSNALRLDVPL